MSVGEILYAVGVFVVFGAVAVAIGRSASRDRHAAVDGAERLWAFEEWAAAALAAAVAIGGPIVILVNAT